MIDVLRAIRQEGNPSLQEACILTWGQLGRSVLRQTYTPPRTDINRAMDDRNFVFVLLELVEYLGHANPIISGIAYCEVYHVSSDVLCTLLTFPDIGHSGGTRRLD